MLRQMIDLDANATTPLLPEVLDAMLPWLRDGHANASGAYASAKRAKEALRIAREQVAALIRASPDEIVFTGGGTESVNTALHSLHRLSGPGAVVVSAIEHSSVLRYVEALDREVRLVPVTSEGRVDPTAFATLLDGAAFVSIMTANNETGVLQPIAELAAIARERSLPFHTDAIQMAGKAPLDVKSLDVDLLSLSAHKFHGPKGVGALYLRHGLRFSPLLLGGGQESGRRSGTENVPGIVGMGVAAELMHRHLESDGPDRIAALRARFEARLAATVSGIHFNGDRAHRLPNTSHVSFDRCDSAGLLILLDEAGVACSAGSACMTGKQRPSHVQLAMGIPESLAKSSLRFSFSKLTTDEDAESAATAVARAVEKLRRVQGSGVGPVVVYSP